MWADDKGKTRLGRLHHSGSSKLVLPRAQGAGAQAVAVNTAGGITGGDHFELELEVREGAHLSVTTQAAERAYQAQPGEIGTLRTIASVGAGARLDWLPQELILFDRCALSRKLEIDLAKDASLLMVEPMVFGRGAMGETLKSVTFQDRICIRRDGALVYLDAMALHGDAAAHLARPAIAGGAGAMASVVFAGPDAGDALAGVRALLPRTAGATVLDAGLLVVRLLAADGFELRRSLIPILEHLAHSAVPKSWRL